MGKAYIFIGYIWNQKKLYADLQEAGFTLIFKDVVFDNTGKAKGNCDADLITKAMVDTYENNLMSAILITSDGDYTPSVKFWLTKNILITILSPSTKEKCSVLLKRTGVKISYINDKKTLLKQ